MILVAFIPSSVMLNEYSIIFFEYLGNLYDIDSSYLFPQIDQIIDPVVDSTYKDIWMATAKVRKRKTSYANLRLILVTITLYYLSL